MDNEKTIVLDLRVTRKNALFILTAFFLCWHPGFLGSEQLSITSYYPAPYGGYTTLLTSGQTLLSRDGGVAASYVRIGAGYNGGGSRRDATIKLEVGDGAISATDAIRWGTARGGLYPSQGGAIELGGSGGTPYVDFSRTMVEDYSARLILSQAGRLQVVGDFSITGTLRNVCERVSYSLGTVTPCPANKLVVGYLGDGSPRVTGYLPKNATTDDGLGTMISLGQDWAGTMVCCRFQ